MSVAMDATPAVNDATLQRFCLAHAEACVVPAEALRDDGIAAPVADWLLAAGRLSAGQLRCLEAGHALYTNAAARSCMSARRISWFPPRRTNLLIAADAQPPRGHLEPFGGTSSLLYACDLDTHAEYVAALLIHMERLSLLRSVPATVTFNLSYWFDRDAAERRAFVRAGCTTPRRGGVRHWRDLRLDRRTAARPAAHPRRPPTEPTYASTTAPISTIRSGCSRT